MSMPPPSRTPTRPIRPNGEIPNSQDDDEGHSSDFEDLLEEATEEDLPSTSTSPPASSPLQTPAVHAAPSLIQKPATTTKPLLQLPSTAAHTLPFNTPPISNTSNTHPPTTTQPSTSTPTTASTPNPLHTRLSSQFLTLQSQITTLQSQLSTSNALRPDPTLAPSIVRSHIKLLHSYNEIKDVGLGLMGLIADGRGVRLGDVMGEFGVGGGD